MANFYDQLEVDIEKQHIELNNIDKTGLIFKKNTLFDRFLFKNGYYHKFINSGLISFWFDEFSIYWSHILGGRPLKFHDFFYLYCDYRKKFQSVSIEDHNDTESILSSWQNYNNLYLTFGSLYRYSLDPFYCFDFNSILSEKKGGQILEYGCGMAPIVTSMIRNNKTNYSFTIADIRSFTYHYAKWLLKSNWGGELTFVDLEPFKKTKLENKYDIIFLMTVLEHLPDPLNVIQYLTEYISESGYLVFDYIKSEGKGLDSTQGVQQRESVLTYIAENYELVSGKIDIKNSIGTTIVRKK